jgi:uncharacterized repeat protein (TIGR03803 family)
MPYAPAVPRAGLIQGPDGNLYGTAVSGGYYNAGAIIGVSLDGTSQLVVHTFSGGDGASPASDLTIGIDGKFYGTTLSGGSYGGGTIFNLTLDNDLTVLHAFGEGTDGVTPGSLTQDAVTGTFYGSTYNGGRFTQGTVFSMQPDGAMTLLHNFSGAPSGAHVDGANPAGHPTLSSTGELLGATYDGGSANSGTIYRLTPNP